MGGVERVRVPKPGEVGHGKLTRVSGMEFCLKEREDISASLCIVPAPSRARCPRWRLDPLSVDYSSQTGQKPGEVESHEKGRMGLAQNVADEIDDGATEMAKIGIGLHDGQAIRSKRCSCGMISLSQGMEAAKGCLSRKSKEAQETTKELTESGHGVLGLQGAPRC